MNILRKILHCNTNNSDKVYIIDVNKLNTQPPYIVTATWGKREAPRLSSQIKGEFASEWQATDLAKRLINDKRKSKDYNDAASNLVIPGLKPLKLVSAAHIHESNRIAVDRSVTIDLVDDQTLIRSIKV